MACTQQPVGDVTVADQSPMSRDNWEALHQSGSKGLLWRKAMFVCGIVLGCFSCIVGLFPQFGVARSLSVYLPFAQVLAFPQALGLVILLLGGCATGVGWRRRWSRLALTSCLVWIVAGAGFLFAPNGIPHQVSGQQHSTVTEGNLTVVTFNTGSTLTASDFQQLVSTWDPDIIVLPETSGYELREAIETSKYDGQLFETRNDGLPNTYTGQIAPTSVVVNKRLGAAHFTRGPVTSFGTVAIEFDDARLPVILGLHTAPPLPRLMNQWRDDINRVVEFGNSIQKPLIIAGDFNATLRHGPLATRGRLIDSQELCSTTPTGTWPAGAPNLLRSPIDHIFVTQGITAHSCQVQQIGYSDHLAYKTQVAVQ